MECSSSAAVHRQSRWTPQQSTEVDVANQHEVTHEHRALRHRAKACQHETAKSNLLEKAKISIHGGLDPLTSSHHGFSSEPVSSIPVFTSGMGGTVGFSPLTSPLALFGA
jgi:hypothetical protein